MGDEKHINKNEILLCLGTWTSKLGNIVFDYANSISIVGAFASNPFILAIYQSSETVIQVIFNLIGGAKADQKNKKKIAVTTDLFSAIICLALSFFVNSIIMAEIMIAANALLAIVSAFNSPTYKSIVREVIERDRIGFFNSIQNGGAELIKIVGPFVGILLVGFIGVRGALIFDAITFAVSAFLEAMLTKIQSCEEKKEKENVLRSIVGGFCYLRKEKQILLLLILSAIVNFFLAGYNLLLPYTDLMYSPGFYSKALALEAAGGIIGSIISSSLSKKNRKFAENGKGLIIILCLTGLALVLEPVVGIIGVQWLCLLVFLCFGIMLTLFNIQFLSHIQICTAEEYLGRVFSITFTVAVLFMPVGSVFFAWFCNTLSDTSFAIVGGGIIVVSMVFYVVEHRFGEN